MSWRLRLIDAPVTPEQHAVLQAGDCWEAPFMIADDSIGLYYLEHALSRQYMEQQYGKRPPYIVYLPPGLAFCVDAKYRGGSWGDNHGREGWTVEGELPAITVSPSVNLVGIYHGWLRDGAISADVEGRSFP